jgi:hypothetical protein
MSWEGRQKIVVAYSKVISNILPEGLRKSSRQPIPAGIQTGFRSNTKKVQ